METVFQLIYISFATENFNEDQDVKEILEKSRDNNDKFDITGILLYRGGIFMQLLEGKKEVVLKLFHMIEKDKRHRSSKIIVQSNNNNRLFSNWTMCYKPLKDSDLENIKSILPWSKLIEMAKQEEPIPEYKVLKIVKKFALEV